MAKLILLRGNSGSGKTTVAKALQKKLGHDTMLISQDMVKREILYVKKGEHAKIGDFIFQLVMYGKKNCEIIILEGIFSSERYSDLFKKLLEEFQERLFAFYFDVSLEETLKRHQTRACANEFGEKEMREWWKEKDLLKVIPEELLGEELKAEETVNLIYKKIKE